MKKTIKPKIIQHIAGAFALALVFGFAFAACSSPTSLDNGQQTRTPPPETSFSVSGSFTKTGGVEVKFSLSDAGSIGSFARSVTSNSYAVSGELVDGDIIFRLSGTYDPVQKSYTASSSSSIIRYSINGAFNEEGESLGSTATLLVRDSIASDNWTAFSYVIDEAKAVVIDPTDYIEAEPVSGGIPAFARGWWNYSETYGGYRWDVNVLLSEWTITQDMTETDPQGGKEFQSFSAAVVDVSQAGSTYNVIVGYPVYVANKAQAEAAATAFATAQGLIAALLDESPYVGIDDGYYWYVEQGDGFLTYGFLLPEEWMSGESGPGPFFTFISDFELSFIGEHGHLPNKAEAENAIEEFLLANNIDAEKLDGPKEPPVIPDSLVYWYNEEWNDITWAYFPDFFTGTMEWDLIMPWYTTNCLERYLIDAGETPHTRYSKHRIIFSSNDTTMTIADYGVRNVDGQYEWYEYECNTVNEARAITTVDINSVITISR